MTSGVEIPGHISDLLPYLPWILLFVVWIAGEIRSYRQFSLIAWIVKRQPLTPPGLPSPGPVEVAPPSPKPVPVQPKPEPTPLHPVEPTKPTPTVPTGEPTDHSFQAYRADYALRWAAMKIMPQHQSVIDHDVAKVIANKTRYEGVSSSTGVPWYVIGILDVMEAGGGCSAHLHNGDPLSGRTIHVPAGRPPPPAEPPFTWEQSALDALAYDHLDQVKVWDAETIAWCFERFNGFGYRSKGVPTPYLWSFSNQYTSGKFVKDHVFDPAAVSEQAGAMTLLKGLVDHDPSIKL